MNSVRSFDGAKLGLSSDPETDTMGDPRSEGRGLVAGALIAVVFWTSLAGLVWWLRS